MKALTIRQPWAHLIANGIKDVENRVSGTSYRGPLAIHVAKQWAFDDRTLDDAPFQVRRELGEDLTSTSPEFAGTYGHVIAVVDLVDCHTSDGHCCSSWGWWHDPRSNKLLRHLVLENPRRLAHPQPAKGRLGLWDIDDRNLRAAS